MGLIVAIAVYRVTDSAPALELSRTGVAALAEIGTAAMLVQLYRNGADAVIQTARWVVAAAIEHAVLVLLLSLFAILFGTHATRMGGGDGTIRAGPRARAVGGPQYVGLRALCGVSSTFEAPPVYPGLFVEAPPVYPELFDSSVGAMMVFPFAASHPPCTDLLTEA